MKRAQRILSWILSASLLAGSAGCSSSKPSGSAAPPASAASGGAAASSAVSSAPEAQPWDKYEPVDLKGRTITIAYNWQHIPSVTTEKLDSKTVTKGEIQDMKNMQRIEKKYNCKIKYINIPYDQLYKKLTASVMAGAPCADLITQASGMVMNGIKSNMIEDLDKIFPKNADIINDQKFVVPAKFFGKTYAMNTYNIGTNGGGIGFNRDLIKKIGVEMPDDLYEKGEWNWDNFLKIAKAATLDTNGDGKNDQWGLGGIPYNLMPQFIASNGGYLFDGENMETGLDNPKTVEAFNLFNTLYNVEKVAYLKNTKGDWWSDKTSEDFKNGNIAMFYIELYMIPSEAPKLSFQIGFVPTPKGPSDTEGKSWMRCDGGMVIPKGVSDPTVVYQIFEELASPWGSDFETRDKDAKKWLEKCFPTEKDIGRYQKNSLELYKLDYSSAIEDWSCNSVISNIIRNGDTVAKAVKENKQQSQAKIDTTMKAIKAQK